MVVTAQNAWPSVEHDAMSITALGNRMMPVGFYYKTFIHPRALWPFYEKILRNAAGLGRVDPETQPGEYDKQYLHTDLAVVGGGPAGLSAGLAAASQGLRVIIVDENMNLGGHLCYSRAQHRELLDDLMHHVHGNANITVLANTTVIGTFEENWLSAVSPHPDGARLYKIRAESVIYATGVYEQPLLFDNNDLPGIMLGSAVQRLIRLYGVAPGRQAVVITANDDGWAVAADLLAAGIELAAVVDARPHASSEAISHPILEGGVAVYWESTAQSAAGGHRVRAITITKIKNDGVVELDEPNLITCDLVAVSVGWSPANGLIYQAGGRMAFDQQRGEFLPEEFPDGVYAAGRVAGTHDVDHELTDGKLAGLRAAAFLGQGNPPDVFAVTNLEAAKAAEPVRTSNHMKTPGVGKRILCYCEDVTDKDLEMSIAEGYNSIELLKRYSTISMGPCQGKMCSQNTLHLCARANGWTIAETGTTTSRPPIIPVSLGALAGKHMEPEQVTPVHDWHRAKGAKMMVAGLWIRPEHYGDPTAEIQAVRRNVGIIDVSTLGKFRLTGPGVPDLLEHLYINKWRNLKVGCVRYGVMCNDEGIILDDGVTAHVAEREWYMTTTSSGSEAIFEWIQWWLQSGWGAGVQAVNVSEAFAAFNLAGPRAREVLAKLTDIDLSNETFPYMAGRDAIVAGVVCRLLRIGFTGELSYEIHCPAGFGLHVWEELLAAGRDNNIRPFGVEAQRVLRLEKAHLIVGQDTDGLTDPIAADMETAVKLDKPDFLGRRAIARVKQESPKQRLVGFKMVQPEITPDEGLQIVRQLPTGGLESIGWVTSSRYSPTLEESIGLCWLSSELADHPGKEFAIRMNGRLEIARVHHGPFYDPHGQRLRG